MTSDAESSCAQSSTGTFGQCVMCSSRGGGGRLGGQLSLLIAGRHARSGNPCQGRKVKIESEIDSSKRPFPALLFQACLGECISFFSEAELFYLTPLWRLSYGPYVAVPSKSARSGSPQLCSISSLPLKPPHDVLYLPPSITTEDNSTRFSFQTILIPRESFP